MSQDHTEILSDVQAQLSMITRVLRDLANKRNIDKDTALIVAEQADRIGSQMKEINRVVGWNGCDFSGDGTVITANYNASELHAVTKAVIDAVGGRPAAEIAHVIPTILELIFPQLAARPRS